MSDLLTLALFVLCLILLLMVIVAALLGILLLAYYGIMSALDAWTKPQSIETMKNFPEGTIFTAHSKAATEAFEKILPVFEFEENMDAEEMPIRVGSELAEQIKASKKVFKEHGIYRHIRFLDLRLTPQKNGSAYRKWNNTGKEWQACELSGSMLEMYTDANGNDLADPSYFSTVNIIFSMSRRLREEEKKNIQKKDKWGRKIPEQKDYYRHLSMKNCPSCGAPLPQDMKDIVCPSCGSTIFADYYDWQIESIEFELASGKKTIAELLKSRQPGERVIYKGKKIKNKITRFSENDFRLDVLESCRDEIDKDKLLVLFLGTIEIKSVTNTENQTSLDVKFPIFKTVIDENGKILSSEKTIKTKFTRARYPNKFNKNTAVISAEKECPNCGGPFSPDEKGNCPYCGTFLYKENFKWKKSDS